MTKNAQNTGFTVKNDINIQKYLVSILSVHFRVGPGYEVSFLERFSNPRVRSKPVDGIDTNNGQKRLDFCEQTLGAEHFLGVDPTWTKSTAASGQTDTRFVKKSLVPSTFRVLCENVLQRQLDYRFYWTCSWTRCGRATVGLSMILQHL
jgi:hypothetical protein